MAELGDFPMINCREDFMKLKGALKPKGPRQLVIELGHIRRELDRVSRKFDGLVRISLLSGPSGFPTEQLGENRNISDPFIQLQLIELFQFFLSGSLFPALLSFLTLDSFRIERSIV